MPDRTEKTKTPLKNTADYLSTWLSLSCEGMEIQSLVNKLYDKG
jgi:hypothetical protein